MTRYIITAAPPNPNGDLHLGHLAGPFLGADVQARYLRAKGEDVTHVGYIDEHSCYVTRRARELGGGARETAHRLGNRIETTLTMAAMHPEFVGRPHRDPWHDATVQHYFLRLWEQGAFTVQTVPVYYCTRDEQFLYEAEVRGLCHHCSAPSDGFYCEECGLPQESGSLDEPKCTTCWQAPEVREHERIVFELDTWRDQLSAHYEGYEPRPHLRTYLDKLLAGSLPATPVSRIGGYGVPVPLAEWEGHYLDTWFSGIWGYVAATEGAHRVRGLGGGSADWHADDTRVVEFLGFDCSFSHAVLWTAFALALDEVVPPYRIHTNEFYKLEGGKFSTSRDHAIWGGDVLGRIPVDSLRFHLCLTGPETDQTNFAAADFLHTTTTVLSGGLEVIVKALAELGEFGAAEEGLDLAARSRALVSEVAAALEPEDFSPARAAAAIASFVSEAGVDPARWAGPATRSAVDEVLADIATACYPIMPGWAGDLSRAVRGLGSSVESLEIGAGQPGWTVQRDGVATTVRGLAASAI